MKEQVLSYVTPSLQKIILNKGDSYNFPPNTTHQVWALEDSQIIETSNIDAKEDYFKIVKGD